MVGLCCVLGCGPMMTTQTHMRAQHVVKWNGMAPGDKLYWRIYQTVLLLLCMVIGRNINRRVVNREYESINYCGIACLLDILPL